MVIKPSASHRQIRWYVQQAINAWETLDHDIDLLKEVQERALHGLLRYLDDVESAEDLHVRIDEQTATPLKMTAVVAAQKEAD